MEKSNEPLIEKVGALGIVCMPGCEEFVEKVQNYIQDWRKQDNNYIVKTSFPRFASGEAKGLIRESVRGRDIYIITDIFNYSVTYKMYGMTVPMSPDDHFQDLKRAISAMAGKPKRITVIMPMLYEGRQHKRSSRESLDCALALKELVNMGVSNIITFDAHDARVQNAIPLSGFDNIHPTYQMMKSLLNTVDGLEINDQKLGIISPDEGGVSRCLYYSSVLNVNVGMFYKRRNYSEIVDGSNPIEAHEYLGKNIKGKDIIVVDDMISSGGSMLDIFKSLKERGARRIFAFSSFGLFCNGLEKFDEAYARGEFDKIFTTNLIYGSDELLGKEWYQSVDMSKYVSYIIEELNRDQSISSLIDPFKKIQDLIAEFNAGKAN
ncbi:MAG: ribose-phosphate pyrophosphokinase [Oscillospiraceae bacterium]